MSTQTVSLRLLLTGNAGAELRRIAQQNQRDTRIINDMQRLGIRTQRQVHQEIRNQERAYRRLRASGVASANDLRRAHRAMREEIRRLNGELRTSGSLMGKMQTAGAIAGGTVAAGAVVNSQIKPAREYDEMLSDLTITAADRGDGFKELDAIKKSLDTTIVAAARQGGSRDGAVLAAEQLIGSGEYDSRTVGEALNATTRTAFAAGADPSDVANATIAMKNFGIAANEIQKAMTATYIGGQLGSFEVKDQARWLPSQLASAGTVGYSGVEGVQRVVAMNQVAKRVAGSSDQAGNFVTNFLDKLASTDFSKAIADNIAVRQGDPKNADGEFDWQKYALQQREQGVMAADAFVKLIDREMANNAEYQKLKAQEIDPNNEKQVIENLSGMLSLLEGSSIASILTDREARAGALSLSKYNGEYQGMVSEMAQGGDVVENHALWKSQQEHATYQQRINEQLNIGYKSYVDINGQLATFNTQLAGFMQEHEGLAKAAYKAGTALAALGAAGVVGGALGGVTGGGGLAGAARMAKTGGALGLAAGVGVTIGTGVNYAIEGTAAQDWIGEKVAQGLSLLGNENAQAALDANAKYDQMIAEQQETKAKQDEVIASNERGNQLQTQVATQLGIMTAHLSNIAAKPVPTFNPTITIGGRSTAMNMMDEVSKQSKRGKFGPYI